MTQLADWPVLLTAGFCARFFRFALAQDDNPCAPELDAKTIKLIEKGTDKRKYDADKGRDTSRTPSMQMKPPFSAV